MTSREPSRGPSLNIEFEYLATLTGQANGRTPPHINIRSGRRPYLSTPTCLGTLGIRILTSREPSRGPSLNIEFEYLATLTGQANGRTPPHINIRSGRRPYLSTPTCLGTLGIRILTSREPSRGPSLNIEFEYLATLTGQANGRTPPHINIRSGRRPYLSTPTCLGTLGIRILTSREPSRGPSLNIEFEYLATLTGQANGRTPPHINIRSGRRPYLSTPTCLGTLGIRILTSREPSRGPSLNIEFEYLATLTGQANGRTPPHINIRSGRRPYLSTPTCLGTLGIRILTSREPSRGPSLNIEFEYLATLTGQANGRTPPHINIRSGRRPYLSTPTCLGTLGIRILTSREPSRGPSLNIEFEYLATLTGQANGRTPPHINIRSGRRPYLSTPTCLGTLGIRILTSREPSRGPSLNIEFEYLATLTGQANGRTPPHINIRSGRRPYLSTPTCLGTLGIRILTSREPSRGPSLNIEFEYLATLTGQANGRTPPHINIRSGRRPYLSTPTCLDTLTSLLAKYFTQKVNFRILLVFIS